MPPIRPFTPLTGITSLSRSQSGPYPPSRPFNASRSTPTSRPRTGRPRTATSVTGTDSNVIAAVTEGTMFHLQHISIQVVALLLLSDCASCRWIRASASLVRYELERSGLMKISDSQTYGKTIHKLTVFDPVEVYHLGSLLTTDCDA